MSSAEYGQGPSEEEKIMKDTIFALKPREYDFLYLRLQLNLAKSTDSQGLTTLPPLRTLTLDPAVLTPDSGHIVVFNAANDPETDSIRPTPEVVGPYPVSKASFEKIAHSAVQRTTKIEFGRDGSINLQGYKNSVYPERIGGARFTLPDDWTTTPPVVYFYKVVHPYESPNDFRRGSSYVPTAESVIRITANSLIVGDQTDFYTELVFHFPTRVYKGIQRFLEVVIEYSDHDILVHSEDMNNIPDTFAGLVRQLTRANRLSEFWERGVLKKEITPVTLEWVNQRLGLLQRYLEESMKP